jgi:hypothetical protein
MFEATLKAQIERIFDLDKVTYDLPSESQEQEAAFIQVDTARPTIKDGRQFAIVQGRIRVFANAAKLPYGYMAKKIKAAAYDDTKNFFFEVEQNLGTINNICERALAFTYFFNSQYDPALGTLTTLETEVEEQ